MLALSTKLTSTAHGPCKPVQRLEIEPVSRWQLHRLLLRRLIVCTLHYWEPLLLLARCQASGCEALRTRASVREQGVSSAWGALDDVVMGGRSESGFDVRPGAGEDGGAAGMFSGRVRTSIPEVPPVVQQNPLLGSPSMVCTVRS